MKPTQIQENNAMSRMTSHLNNYPPGMRERDADREIETLEDEYDEMELEEIHNERMAD